ncbi:MAG: MBL fold metallo-hydrolase [Acidobacteriota bacterium]
MSLRATLVGTGTSTGVPVIGCRCEVCTSPDPRNRRLRTSLSLERADGRRLWIDTTPDFRQQALGQGVDRLDAVLFTHAHADHIYGLDDLRAVNFRQKSSIPCYGARRTLETLRAYFAYIFEPGQEGGGKPQIDLRQIDGPFEVIGLSVIPVPVRHGSWEVLGFRFGDFAYVTDCNFIPEASFDLLAGVEVLVLGALRHRPHSTHFTLEEGLAVARRLAVRRVFFTHLSHEIDHAAVERSMPPEASLGYDGLVLTVG